MGRKRYSAEQIIRMLRQAEVLLSQGRSVPEICRELGVTSNNILHQLLALLKVPLIIGVAELIDKPVHL